MRNNVALTASGIVKRYGKQLVLDDAKLVLHPRKVVAVVGENGTGKTSLRIGAGLLAADAGDIQLRGRVGYCPQQPALFDLLTAEEHLVLFGRGIGLECATARREGAGRHLEHVLRVYRRHYNEHRPHCALRLLPPEGEPGGRDPTPLTAPAGPRRRDLLGGLIHEYDAA